MGRHQTGYLYKALGGWHVRYWKTELKGAKPIRVQRSEKLCDADDKATKSSGALEFWEVIKWTIMRLAPAGVRSRKRRCYYAFGAK